MPSYASAAEPRTRLALFHRSLVQGDETPLKSLLSDERINDVLAEEGISFGADEDAVYTPAVTLWGLLSQVFFKAEQRSCLAAVVRISALWLSLGRTVSSTNTGAYCRARRRISAEVLRKLTGRIAFTLNSHKFRLAHQATLRVGHRPSRSEPRVNKRRPKILKLMIEPRTSTRPKSA